MANKPDGIIDLKADGLEDNKYEFVSEGDYDFLVIYDKKGKEISRQKLGKRPNLNLTACQEADLILANIKLEEIYIEWTKRKYRI